MILKALYDYYYRQKKYGGDMAPIGFKEQEIHFVIVLDAEGNPLRVEDRRIDKRTSQKFYVVSDSRSSGIKPYIFYDNLEYVLALVKNDNPKKTLLKHSAFVNKCRELSQRYPQNKTFKAVTSFYDNDGPNKIKSMAVWEEMQSKAGAVVSFLLNGEEQLAACQDELANEVAFDTTTNNGYCLVSGEAGPICEITTGLLIPGGNTTGAKIVSFQENSGYDSYGKKKGFNAPITKKAEAAFSASLLKLLGKDSANKFTIANRTFVFWASTEIEAAKKAQDGIRSLFGAFIQSDNPDKGREQVQHVFKSIFSGAIASDSNDRFYMLGLAPNVARIAVNFWIDSSLKEISGAITRHFDDMEIIDTRKEKTPYRGLYQITSSVTQKGKVGDLPNLHEAVVKSILEGVPYPYTLYSAALRRIRAELKDGMRITRIAILKAYLNRNNNNQKQITVMLDTTNNNAGYICGRLFALLEYTQKSANGINSIRERYMNSASATPSAVFATLLNLNVHHIEKLEHEGQKIRIEKLKQEIISQLPSSGFPAHLNLNDQGRFFVGYYHQMQDMYTKKNNDNTETINE